MTFAKHTTRQASFAKAATALLLTATAFGLAGCKHDEGQGARVAGWSLVDPEQRHPIMVSQEPAVLNLRVARGSQGLTPSQRADVIDFTSRYRAGDTGNSRLVISVPSGSANEVAAITAAEDIRELLFDGGFSEASVSVEAYHEESSSHPPVRIAYMRYIAKGPDCGNDWSENLARNSRNIGHPNFGCANQHNLAAQIANPADLLGPRTQGERYSDRRDTVMNNWTNGKVTGSEKSQDERLRVKGAE